MLGAGTGSTTPGSATRRRLGRRCGARRRGDFDAAGDVPERERGLVVGGVDERSTDGVDRFVSLLTGTGPRLDIGGGPVDEAEVYSGATDTADERER